MPAPRAGMVTARDLARQLGVSQSMVSRAFSPGASIAPEMRARILEAATAMGYRPNIIAASLSRRRSSLVGLVMGELSNPFYPAVLEQLSQALQAAGFQTLLLTVPPGQEADAALPMLRQYHVDAVVVTSASLSSAGAAHWLGDGRAALLFNRAGGEDTPLDSVACDNVAGGRMAAEALLERGRRHIAFVAGRADTSTSREREAGFFAVFAERGLPPPRRIEAGGYSYEAGHRAALAAGDADGLFFANDILALGGLDALRHGLGRRVPEAVSVIGFDDIPMAAWPAYGLATLRQPVAAMVAASVALLRQRLAGEAGPAPHRQRLPAELLRRASL
ncbi:LacI family DNA-binding transcriptional regulator [Pseudoroseomonas cervicalis]|uniref:LacI family DNA-binding transcriptional regulator n=1 Tax=Teichococcus cervicalis TaxID=204525 RepID=UPI002787A280|nr:LacI family DNA-binding transcriptional regulator [Pseudoroseomonas cervicalis]MDQ1078345.1 DNA-binding LacI/PurR family transcriptional regulator [Pseudoroseomonas cervicalis]